VVVLEFEQLVTELRAVMVVDQCQRAGDFVGIRLPRSPSERIADKLPDRLTPRRELFLFAVPIKLLQQIIFERNRKTDDFRHGMSPHGSKKRLKRRQLESHYT
jgi:hypothetical protein